MKKYLYTLLLSFFALNTSYCCTCAYVDVCQYISDLDSLDTKLIFKGSFIERQPVDNFFEAVKFKVDKIYRGEIVTPDSPLYVESTWNNTDSTVWMLTGDSAACFRIVGDDEAIFVLNYWPSFEGFGYAPSICANDYFPIENEMVSGIDWNDQPISLPLTEFEEALMTNCESLTSVENPSSIYSNQTNVYPQPTSDFVKIDIPGDIRNWQVHLLDVSGRQLFEVRSPMLNLLALEPGIYIIRFRKEDIFFSKRVVKL